MGDGSSAGTKLLGRMKATCLWVPSLRMRVTVGIAGCCGESCRGMFLSEIRAMLRTYSDGRGR